MKKKILFLILAFVVSFGTLVSSVKAGTPDLASNVTFYHASLDASVTKVPNISTTYYKYVIDPAKQYSGIAYCMNVGYNNPPEGSTVSRTADITSPRLRYIIEHGYSAIKGSIRKGDLAEYSDFEAYYITQLAVWLYVGSGKGGYNANQYDANNRYAQRAIQLYNASATIGDDYSYPSIGIAIASFDMKYDAANKRYISEPMHAVGYGFTKYNIRFSNAPEGTKLIWENGTEIKNGSDVNVSSGNFYLVVPESSVTGNVSGIKVTAASNMGVNKVYLYEYADKSKQPLGIMMPEIDTYSQTHELKITKKGEPKLTCEQAIEALKNKYPDRTENNKAYINELNNLKKEYTINTDTGIDNPRCSKPACEEVIAYLKNKYSDRSENNKNYVNELNNLKTRYTDINTDAGIENPSCQVPTCEDIISYLKKKYPTRNENNKNYVNELESYKKKYTDINTDTGIANPSCKKPSCDEVVTYLKNKYSDRTEKNKEYTTELETLKDKYEIYTDQGIANPSCSPAPGNPRCEEKVKELLDKYPNVPDRNKDNSQYVKELDDLVKFGQENGFTVHVDDIQYPDCVKHYKRELIIRKIDAATGNGIAGAKLQLKDESGNVIREWVTDGNPYVIPDLPAGKYTLTEIETPAGYTGDGFIEFTLEGEEYSKEISLKNSKIPDTADLNFTLIVTAFILFLGFGVFGLIKTSKAEM